MYPPAPIVTCSFFFQRAVLDGISLGFKKKKTKNLESSSIEITKENMTKGRKPISHQLVESLFLFKIISPLHHLRNG